MNENLAQNYADSLAETFAELVTAIEDGAEIYDGQDPREYLDEMPLEIIAEVGEPYSVVFTVGGPFAEVTWTARAGAEWAELRTAWGSDRGRVTSDAVRYVARYFAEMMGTD